ncbi:uncharacterized protein LOC121374478 [Gigantopelta aegis]|uniref:uncharacterized protein LOC121374478 n=1 Tax=Gigantopelta aegis TaxID=1735272 RepID=UPI001B888D80|nr:uncharacterized protein LOC121374478 [Gigantopelta aegis]
MLSGVREFGFLVAIVACCRGILIVKLSEKATAKMIAQTLEKMDYQLFNMSGKSIISASSIQVANISASHLEGVVAHVSFLPDGKMTLTVNIQRMRCTVDVRGNLMGFISVDDMPVVEFIDSTLIINITMGTSGESKISTVTYCNMTVRKADVTSQHWAVNIAKIKVVPQLTSGSHVTDKLCPHIEEKLLGNMLTLIGLAGSTWIGLKGINASFRVVDRGIIHSHLYIVYQESENQDNILRSGQRDLAVQPMAGLREMEFFVHRRFVETPMIKSQSEYEEFINKNFTLIQLEKYFTTFGSLRLKQLGYSGQWTCLAVDSLPLQIDQGKTTLPIQTTLAFNITSKCAQYTLLTFIIDMEATISAIAQNTAVIFHTERWRERVRSITSTIHDVTDTRGLASEFKLYEFFHPSENATPTLGLSYLIPRGLALSNVTLTANGNYLVVETDLDLRETSNQTDAYVHHDTEPEYDVSSVKVTYDTLNPEVCAGTYSSNPDRNIVFTYDEVNASQEHNISAHSASMALSGRNYGNKLTLVLLVITVIYCRVYFS